MPKIYFFVILYSLLPPPLLYNSTWLSVLRVGELKDTSSLPNSVRVLVFRLKYSVTQS